MRWYREEQKDEIKARKAILPLEYLLNISPINNLKAAKLPLCNPEEIKLQWRRQWPLQDEFEILKNSTFDTIKHLVN